MAAWGLKGIFPLRPGLHVQLVPRLRPHQTGSQPSSSSSGDPPGVSRGHWGAICQVGTAHARRPSETSLLSMHAASFIAPRCGVGSTRRAGRTGGQAGSATGPQEGEGAAAAAEIWLRLLRPGLHRHQALRAALVKGDAVGDTDLQSTALPAAREGGREVRLRGAAAVAPPDPSRQSCSPLAVGGQHAHQLPDAVVQRWP